MNTCVNWNNKSQSSGKRFRNIKRLAWDDWRGFIQKDDFTNLITHELWCSDSLTKKKKFTCDILFDVECEWLLVSCVTSSMKSFCIIQTFKASKAQTMKHLSHRKAESFISSLSELIFMCSFHSCTRRLQMQFFSVLNDIKPCSVSLKLMSL